MSAPEKEAPPSPMTVESSDQPSQKGEKVSWANVVNKSSLSKHEYEVTMVDGAATVEIPDEIVQNSVPLWEDFLEGHFLGDAPHAAKIHVIVNKIWPVGDKTVRIDVFPVNQTTVKFRIKDEATRRRIQRRGMWNIADIPMVVSKWAPESEKEEAKPEIKTIPMWITIKNVPHKMFSRKGLGFIASAVGHPVRLHPETELCTSFEEARIFVEADVHKTFPKKHRFKSKAGIDTEVEFVYPWLPARCSICMKWGHKDSACSTNGSKKLLYREKHATAEEGEKADNKTELPLVVVDKEREMTKVMNVVKENQVPLEPEGDVNSPILAEISAQDPPSGKDTSSVPTDTENETWTKAKASLGKHSRHQGEPSISISIVSPTRFDILGEKNVEGAEDQTEEESEEGEIIQEQVDHKGGKEQQSTLRPQLPRQTKGTNKYLTNSFALNTKASKPSVSSKRKTKK